MTTFDFFLLTFVCGVLFGVSISQLLMWIDEHINKNRG